MINLSKYLKRLFLFKRNKINQLYNRVMPMNELFSDRWEKSKYLKFGKGTSIYDSSFVFGNVKVGENTWIGPFTILDGSGNLEIGSNCSISAGVQVYTHDSVEWAVSGGIKNYQYSPTKIGSNCYIGPNVVISKCITIGDGCLIADNSFVNKSFPAKSKVAGNPAKLIS